MQPSARCVQFIRDHEGFVAKAYRDDGRGVLTIGYGHTGPDVRHGMTITREDGEKYLARDIQRIATGVLIQTSGVSLNQNQFDALVSFAFNVGLHSLKVSTLLKRLKAGDLKGAAAEFPKWVHAGGKPLPGLVERRKAERALFEEPPSE
jgi:lysozyme